MMRFTAAFGLVVLMSAPVTGQRMQPLEPYPATQSRRETTGLTFTPDGKRIIAAGTDGYVTFTDAASGKEESRFEAHKGGVLGLALAPDGRTFATSGADRTIILWDTETGDGIMPLTGFDPIASALAFSPDGKTLATGDHAGRVRLWDPQTGVELRAWDTGAVRVSSLAFTPDGKRLLTGGARVEAMALFGMVADADRCRVWDVASGKQLEVLGPRGAMVALGGRGRLIAVGGYQVDVPNGTQQEMEETPLLSRLRVTLVDQLTRREIRLDNGGGVLALTPDGRFLITARGSERAFHGLDGMGVATPFTSPRGVTVWETASGLPVHTTGNTSSSSVFALAISPDGTRLAIGSSTSSFSRGGSGFRGGRDPRGNRGGGRFDPNAGRDRPVTISTERVRVVELTPTLWDAKKAAAATMEELERAWIDLMSTTPATVYRAIWTLTGAGDNGVAVLTKHLKPAPGDSEQIRRLVADLDARRYPVRAAAFRELRRLGFDAESELRRMQNSPSLESRRRIETLLESLDGRQLDPETLRPLRAVAVLERIGTPAARQLLEKLSKGGPGAQLTVEAKQSLQLPAR